MLCMLVVLTGMLFSVSPVMAQEDAPPKCYVVVGAFKLKKNAEAFTDLMKARYFTTKFRYNHYKNLYYVYTYESENRQNATQELFLLREKYPDLYDAWLYAGNFYGPHIPKADWAQRMESVEVPPVIPKEDIEPDITTSVSDDATEPADKDSVQVSQKEEVVEPAVDEPEGKFWKVYINAINATNLKEVKGKFLVFDAERNKQIDELKTHTLEYIEDPDNRTNRIRIQSDIFGFHEFEHTIDMDDPTNEDPLGIMEMTGDTIMFNVKLARLRKGDIATMYKVYFYKDAAIMKEESIYELNQLLGLMKENEKVKIKIHGHTNGNSHGKVLHLDLDDKDFFTLNGSHEETFASAKKLSLYRAYTIQHWLMDQGISEDRMEIKGWGGKRMIYDKFDSQAEKNVRVEIEILED